MKNIAIIAILPILFQVLLCQWSVNSGTATTTVQFPLNSQIVLAKNYSYINPTPVSSYAEWIWTNVSTNYAIFQTLFLAPYTSNVRITIKANNSYFGYINGISFKVQANNQTDTTVLPVFCGINNLTIVVQNRGTPVQTGALAFNIVPNSYSYDMCAANGYYNYSSCTCECSGIFNCKSPQQYYGYPLCGCKCPNQGVATCNYFNQYYDPNTCQCKCLPTFCKQGFKLEESTCSCRCQRQKCQNGKKWSYFLCGCF